MITAFQRRGLATHFRGDCTPEVSGCGLSLFERADLKLALEDLLHHRVDLVRRRNLNPEIRDRVEAEAIAI